MHEATVAQNLLEVITKEAARQNARPIRAKISCGQLSMVNDEALRFAFSALAEGTTCQGLELQIEHKPLQANCKQCNRTFTLDLHKPTCAHCGSDRFELLPEPTLVLEEIEFQTEQSHEESQACSEDPD